MSTHFLETASEGTCQDTERKQQIKGHSLSGDHIGRNLSGHGKKATKQGALTVWKPHQEGLVRAWKESDQARGTHFRGTELGGTCQNTERKQPSKGHSHTGDRTGRDLSGHGKKAAKQGALTPWRPHQEELVRTWKESSQARGTHTLETTSGGTCQTWKESEPGALTPWRPHQEELVRTWKESSQARGTHSLETISGGTCQTWKESEPGALTPWRPHQEELVRTWKESSQARATHSLETTSGGTCQTWKESEPGALTPWRPHQEELVRTWKESSQARGTHDLETASGGTCQTWKESEPGALTSWRPHQEELVRTQKQSSQARGTHSLETAPGGTCQDTEAKQPGKGHSLPGDRIGRDLLGNGKKVTRHGALTNLLNWRPHWEELVRTQKESDQVRGAHTLETTSGVTCQGTERK